MNFERLEEVFNKHAYKWDRVIGSFPTIHVEVKTGGAEGGSCYGGEAHSYSTGADINTTPCETLLTFIEELFPEITLKKYNEFIGSLKWNFTDHCYTEYYGNYSEYDIKYVTLSDIHRALEAAGLM